jgi:hypothetical protein
VKGIARGGATEYRWDFGDGSPSTSWAPIGNPYAVEATHTYSGAVGLTFVATLYVRDGGGTVDSDTYKVSLWESSDLSNPDHLDVRRNMSIDEGLWWLHKYMVRATYGAGAPGYGQPYGYWNDPGGYPLPATATSVDAFQLNNWRANGDYNNAPYVETVQRGLNYLLYYTYAYDIYAQTHCPDPDTNGNGKGLVINRSSYLYDTRQTYIGGIAMLTMASSGVPNRVAAVGGSHVYGRTYADIVQDMVDFFAWGQVDSGSGRGGWRYHANYSGSDMSTTQWPPLGMMAAETNMGATVPQCVRDELIYFLNYTQHTGCDTNNGGFGYSVDINYPNCTKAAAGIICHEFLGTPLDDPKVASAIGFLYRHWNDSSSGWTYQRLLGNSYGMYGVMKAMRLPGELAVYGPFNPPDGMTEITEYDCTIPAQTDNSFDWFWTTNSQPREGLAHYIVRTQHSDGSWDDGEQGGGPNDQRDAFATGWRILILGYVSINPPVAVICHCDELSAEWNQDIPLDGSCSYHPITERSIVLWEWDFDCDGTYDATGEQATMPGKPDTGIYCVALRVTDDNPEGPLSNTTQCDVSVHPPPHCPIADADGPYDGFVGTPTTYDACDSWDPNDDIATYSWDLDGDGEFDDCTSSHPACTCDWTCSDLGEWGICVEVCDAGEGGFEVCCDTHCTTLDCDNHPPVCDPNGPYLAPQDWTITLDGCGSYDPDPGDTITYAWDLDEDGVYDDCFDCSCPFTTGSVIGEVTDVCIRVTDSFDESCTDCTTVTVVPCPPDPDPSSQGYWHRQCLGIPESEGGIDPGRNGRGPQEPTEPGFVEELMPCADARLEDLGFYGMLTCEGMDADPPSDMCEKAKKQLTALILNVCSDRLMDGCPVDLSVQGCTSDTLVDPGGGSPLSVPPDQPERVRGRGHTSTPRDLTRRNLR